MAGSRRRSTICHGSGVACGSASGTLDKKERSLLRDRSSARWLSPVLMYCGARAKSLAASTNASVRSMCITWLSWLVLNHRQATTAWLSQSTLML